MEILKLTMKSNIGFVALTGFSVKVLDVLQDIIPVVGTGSTKKILNAVSPLLVSVEQEMRLSICHLLVELAKADPAVFPVVILGLPLFLTITSENFFHLQKFSLAIFIILILNRQNLSVS